MATQSEFDEGTEGEEIARVNINTSRAVSMSTIGHFLAELGREAELALGDSDYLVELVEFRQGSSIFDFKKRRCERDEQIERDKRSLDLAEAEARENREHRKQTTLGAALSLAMGTVGVGVATAALMDEGEATTIVISQESCPPKAFRRHDFPMAPYSPAYDYGTQIDGVPVYERVASSSPVTSYTEKEEMMEDYEDGQVIDGAGRVMPRKKDTFRTARNTQLPILSKPDDLRPGQLVNIVGTVRKTETEIGIIIEKFRELDDI